MKFWVKVYFYAEKKIKEQHLKKHSVDLKCSKCRTWMSISGVKYKHRLEDTDFGYKTLCGQCLNWGYWNTDIAPFPIECDKNGVPFVTQEIEE